MFAIDFESRAEAARYQKTWFWISWFSLGVSLALMLGSMFAERYGLWIFFAGWALLVFYMHAARESAVARLWLRGHAHGWDDHKALDSAGVGEALVVITAADELEVTQEMERP